MSDYHLTIPTDLAARMRARRIEVGIPVAQLAVRCGVAPSFIYMLERGERRPSRGTALGLVDALNLPADDAMRLVAVSG